MFYLYWQSSCANCSKFWQLLAKYQNLYCEYDRKTFFVGAAKASCIAKWAQQKCCISAHLDYGHQLGLNITLDYAIGSSSFKVGNNVGAVLTMRGYLEGEFVALCHGFEHIVTKKIS
ncbi:hypothetical protein L1049_026755 [Liquidambar formosana]|uniref:Uncharacterized protein n=1 Tax=Liquidambar formosana TaxID=63359 RepID=A0AAP0NFC9_LIQFO